MNRRTYNRALEGLLIFLIVTAPMAFGAVQPWAYKAASTAVFLMVFIWLARAISNGGFSYIKTPLFYFVPLLILFSVLQVLPLPLFIVDAFSPGRAAMRAAAGVAGDCDTLALCPYYVINRSMHLLSALLLFFLTMHLASSKKSINRIAVALLATGALLAALLFVQKAVIAGKSTLPFINKNHFAGYMELLIPVAAARVAYWSPAGGRRLRNLWKQVHGLMASRTSGVLLALFAACLIMVAAVIHTMSRGGMIGMAFSFVVLIALMINSRKRAAVMLCVTGVLLVLALGWASQEKLGKRVAQLGDIQEDTSSMARISVWRDTLDLSAGFPVTGAGLGCFESVYPFHKTIMKEININQPESDYLYTLSEAGALGLLMAAAFALMFLTPVVRGIFAGDDLFVRGVATGSVCGFAALLAHGVVDTSLHMPAILLTTCVVMGLGYSVVSRRFDDAGDGWPHREARVSFRQRPLMRFVVIAAMPVVIVLAVKSGMGAVADIYYTASESLMEKTQKQEGGPTLHDLESLVEMQGIASYIEPHCPEYAFEKGRAYSMVGEYAEAHGGWTELGEGRKGAQHYYGKAYESFARSVNNNPYSSFPHLMAGRMLEKGFGETQAGETEYGRADRLNPTSPFIKGYLAGYYKKKNDLDNAGKYAMQLPFLDTKYNKVRLSPGSTGYRAEIGETVQWEARPLRPVDNLEYSFLFWRQGHGRVIETPFGPSNTYRWDTSAMEEGIYNVVVRVRRTDQKINASKHPARKAFKLERAGK